jgi:hypothetical protein
MGTYMRLPKWPTHVSVMDERPFVGVQKRPKTIKSDQNGRASSTVSSKSAQKRRAQFNILVLKPL